MELRDYQISAVERVRTAFREGRRRVILASPTGSGKTTMSGELVRLARARGRHVLWIAPSKETLDQCSERLAAIGLSHGIIKAGVKPSPGEALQVASIQTLCRRTKPPAEIVFVDECAHALARTWTALILSYPNAALVGMSAFPARLDGRGLGALFDEIITVATPRQLIEKGWILDPKLFVPDTPNLKGVHVSKGDYNNAELEAVMLQSRLVGNIVETWQRLAGNQITVGFATSIKHSQALTERFVSAGIAAEHLDGGTPAEERRAVLDRLRSGQTRVLWNVGVLCEGWDLPSLAVCILARPTKSQGLVLQQVGRVMRPYPGKIPMILDHAGNVARHGDPTDDIEFSLTDKIKKKRGEAPLRNCPECFCVCLASLAECPECGHVFERAPREEIEETKGELKEFGRSTMEEKNAYLAELKVIRQAKGYKTGWVAWSYKRRFGVWPRNYLTEEEAAASQRAYWSRRTIEAKVGGRDPK